MPMSQVPGDSAVLVGKMEKPHIGALCVFLFKIPCLEGNDSPSLGN